ncbi:acyl transferase 5-like [Lolium rigidum]|uniref:acyl transferase 5-like n=1 Tax=Lolium rigidum TaxID=89674 RepID=UPI001F5CABBE|nr:acyl transferase 5-like [Lolium rigidum]
MQAALQQDQALKDAQAAAEARLAEVVEDSTNSNTVLMTELEEERKARKAAEHRIEVMTTDHREYDQLVMQIDALALQHFPDSQSHRRHGKRHLLRGVLPTVDGYYGNCVYLASVASTGRAVRESPLAVLVGAVREAKEAIAAGFADWMRGDGFYNVSLDYNTTILSDWSRLGFDEVDYGFGVPSYVFPHNDHVDFVPVLNYVSPPAPRRGGIRVVLRCVEEHHAAVLAVELAKFA